MRKLGIGILAGIALIAVAAGSFVYFRPLQAAELSNRYDFWRAGVHDFESAGLHGYTADRCQDTIGHMKQCTCVALVHGLADDAQTWKKLLLLPNSGWLYPLKMYAFDLPGSGGSAAPSVPENPHEAYRVRNQAKALKAAMAPLCARWMVVGNSLGGWVSSWLALDWPEGVDKLILVDSVGLKKGALGSEGASALDAFAHPTVASLKEFQRRAYFKGRPLPEHVWEAAARRMSESNARAVMEAQTSEDYLDGRVSALRLPTLVLWGQADQLVPESLGKALQAQIPASIWVEAPQCGHMPQKECPIDLIRAIGRMLNFGAA